MVWVYYDKKGWTHFQGHRNASYNDVWRTKKWFEENVLMLEGWRQSSMPKEATLNLTNKIPQQPRFLLVGSAYCVFDFSF